MQAFTEVLVVSPYADGRTWYLREGFFYNSSGIMFTTIEVPVGFTTDFASVPRCLWWLFSPWGLYGNASVVHDYLYASQFTSKAVADSVFKEAMQVSGVPAWQIWMLYQAVHVFGGFAWRENASKRAIGLRKHTDALPQANSLPTHWKRPKTP